MPNWSLIADNHQACLDAANDGRAFSVVFCTDRDYDDAYDRYLDEIDCDSWD